MRLEITTLVLGAMLLGGATALHPQVYSPKVLAQDQVDTTDLQSVAAGIYKNAHAVTDREKAEAIWRFYLTDGRFVKPGMFYHIPGWAYEEPKGEVLDPIKLLNSYGFGLCYQDGPLLQATWDAGGFKHTRIWFLTGHTVAEVFYDGHYHLYDSDEMGYTTLGSGSFKDNPVASVQQLEADGNLMLSKLETPTTVKPGAVDDPWYNADVRAAGIGDSASLYTTAADNYVYGYKRYPQGHMMDFVLRPGESITRYYKQPDSKLFYLPYKTDGKNWQEFPQDYGGSLMVNSGPHSEKDKRLWSTGVIEYRPGAGSADAHHTLNQVEYSITSPYVIIGANFVATAALASAHESLIAETSVDAGHTWIAASTLNGPSCGSWKITPKIEVNSQHGSKNAVAGTYGYLVRFTLTGSNTELAKVITDLKLSTLFEFNPRSLPLIVVGQNAMSYSAKGEARNELPVHPAQARDFADKFQNIEWSSDGGQGYLVNTANESGEMIFKLSSNGAGGLTGVDVGGRFLDLKGGLAPDKLTAETRKVVPWPTDMKAPQSASISWSSQPNGPWATVWSFDPNITWPDGGTVKQILRWPEVDRSVRDLNAGSKPIYVRYLFKNLAIDDIRLATISQPPATHTGLTITHTWNVDGKHGEHVEEIDGTTSKTYRFDVPTNSSIENEALTMAAH